MAFGFRTATGVDYGTRTNTVFTAPSGLANDDIMLSLIYCERDGASLAPATPSPPAGFTAVDTPIGFSLGVDFGALNLWWKRAASESGSYTFTHVSQVSSAFLLPVTGCITSGSPIDVFSKNNGLGGTTTGTDVSMSAANQLLMLFSSGWDAFSSTYGTPSGMTVRASGSSNGTFITSEDRAASGATGNRTHSNGNGALSPWAAWMIGLKAVVAMTETINVLRQTVTPKPIIASRASLLTPVAAGSDLTMPPYRPAR